VFPSTSAFQWELPVCIQLIPGVLLLLGTIIVPETPIFLADRGRDQECEVALAWLRGRHPEDVEVEKEMIEIKEAARVSQMLSSNEKSFFQEAKSKAIRKRLGVGIGLMIAQNMVGLNALNYYAPMIFISAGFTSVSSSLFLTGVFGVVKLVSAIAFMFVFVKMKGNRFWLKLGTTVCGISMLVLGEKSQLQIPSRSI
jgi:MFS family permease